jgi:hypothetical protein
MSRLFDVKGKAISFGPAVKLTGRENIPTAKLLSLPKFIQPHGIEPHTEEQRDDKANPNRE